MTCSGSSVEVGMMEVAAAGICVDVGKAVVGVDSGFVAQENNWSDNSVIRKVDVPLLIITSLPFVPIFLNKVAENHDSRSIRFR